MHILETSKMK